MTAHVHLEKSHHVQADQVRIGQWWTLCCHEDLWQIENESDLADIVEMLTDAEPPTPTVWETKLDALAEIREWFVAGAEGWPENQKPIAEIDVLIAEEQGKVLA